MFAKKTTNPGLQKAIDAVLLEMEQHAPTGDNYPQLLDNLTALYALQETNSPKRLSKDTIALIAGNLAGILVIVSYEHAHIVTSKALSFAGKLR